MRREHADAPPPGNRRTAHSTIHLALLAAILALYGLLSAGHARITPVAPDPSVNYINAPDEAAHLRYVRCIATDRSLPRASGPCATYEWHQPPLYYILAAPLYRFGPPAMRGLSVLLGMVGLVGIFLFARTLAPQVPATALLATAFAAFLPMRQAVYGAVNNDAFTEACFTFTLLLCTRAVQRGIRPGLAVAMGVALGVSLVTKGSAFLLIPVVLLALVLALRRHKSTWREYALGASILGMAALIVFPWLHHITILTGEAVPLQTFQHEFQGTMKASDFLEGRGFVADPWTGAPHPAATMHRAEYFATVVNWTFRTFFGAYTPPGKPATLGIPFFMPPQFYVLFGVIGVCAALGWVRLLTSKALHQSMDGAGFLPGLVTSLLVLAAFGGFIWVYFQAQGRYLYPALAPVSTLMAQGLAALVPAHKQAVVFVGLAFVLFLLSVAFLVSGVLPAYSISTAPPSP